MIVFSWATGALGRTDSLIEKIVVDQRVVVLEPSETFATLSLAEHGCQHDGVNDPELVAVVDQPDTTATTLVVKRAFRADRASSRVVELRDLAGISCELTAPKGND